MTATSPRWHVSVPALAASLLLAGSAQAQEELVAGWDFSQWFGDGILSTDAASFQSTLGANYSVYDTSFGAGPDSAAFGTLYFDGSFGSTTVAAGSGTEQFLPTTAPGTGSLTSNGDGPILGGVNLLFDSFSVLQNEGQAFTNALAMQANAPVSVVFEADLTSVPETGNGWSMIFAGKTFSGTAPLTIEFSTDGSGYTLVDSLDLNTTDTAYLVDLSSATSETGYVRFNFSPSGLDFAILDNVAIYVPEPGMVASMAAMLLGLAACARRRA